MGNPVIILNRGINYHSLPQLNSSARDSMYEIIKWPPDMTPSRSPIHFTNELEVAASPLTIWSP